MRLLGSLGVLAFLVIKGVVGDTNYTWWSRVPMWGCIIFAIFALFFPQVFSRRREKQEDADMLMHIKKHHT